MRAATRRGWPDHPVDAAPRFEAQLRQLGALARPGLARDDHYLVVANGGEQLVSTLGDRQAVGVRQPARRDDRVRSGASEVGGGVGHGGFGRSAWHLHTPAPPAIRADFRISVAPVPDFGTQATEISVTRRTNRATQAAVRRLAARTAAPPIRSILVSPKGVPPT